MLDLGYYLSSATPLPDELERGIRSRLGVEPLDRDEGDEASGNGEVLPEA